MLIFYAACGEAVLPIAIVPTNTAVGIEKQTTPRGGTDLWRSPPVPVVVYGAENRRPSVATWKASESAWIRTVFIIIQPWGRFQCTSCDTLST